MNFFQLLANSLIHSKKSTSRAANSQEILRANSQKKSSPSFFSDNMPGQAALLIFSYVISSIVSDNGKNDKEKMNEAFRALKNLKLINKYSQNLLDGYDRQLWLTIIPSKYKNLLGHNKFTILGIPFNPSVFYLIEKFKKNPGNILASVKYEEIIQDCDLPLVHINSSVKDAVSPYLPGLLIASLYYQYRADNNIVLRDKLSILFDMLNHGESGDYAALMRAQNLLHTHFTFCFTVCQKLLALSLHNPKLFDSSRIYTFFSMFDKNLIMRLDSGDITPESIMELIPTDTLQLQPAMRFIRNIRSNPSTPTRAESGQGECYPSQPVQQALVCNT